MVAARGSPGWLQLLLLLLRLGSVCFAELLRKVASWGGITTTLMFKYEVERPKSMILGCPACRTGGRVFAKPRWLRASDRAPARLHYTGSAPSTRRPRG